MKKVHDCKIMWSIENRRGSGRDAVFVAIADALVNEIRRGVRRAGDRLPSTRELSTELGVNRNTVVAAYDELLAQGWITSRGAAGTFVASELPDARSRSTPGLRSQRPREGFARRPGYDVRVTPHSPLPLTATSARFQLSSGVPDPRLFPRTVMARAYRRALRARSANSALAYADPAGSPRLREAIAALLRETRSLPCGPEHVLITRGSQMALDLAARALLLPGDIAAVENLGYQPAWRALEAAGARLVGAPLDEHGVIVDELPAKLRALYVTPHHQYPTTVLLTPSRRIALLERAHRDRFALLEDDYDHEFHFDGRPVAPLASADPHGNVIYIGSLSKTLAPGLRLGFVVAPEPVIAAFAQIRTYVDRQGDHVLESAVAELVEDGEIQRHANKLRRTYAARRERFAALLHTHLGSALDFTLPPGGITIWARVADDIHLDRWLARAEQRGVKVVAAKALALDHKPRPFIRLAFAQYSEPELGEAIRILAGALTTSPAVAAPRSGSSRPASSRLASP
jgi:GntR family transcriptional regulator / MocR family aminotransferase